MAGFKLISYLKNDRRSSLPFVIVVFRINHTVKWVDHRFFFSKLQEVQVEEHIPQTYVLIFVYCLITSTC